MQCAAPSDVELLQACFAGDVDAFAKLVERYQSLVCAIPYAALGDRTFSEDIAQETFLVAWRSLVDLREPAKLRSWLCGIARNLTHNAVRRRRRELPGEAVAQEASSLPATPLDRVLERESEKLVWRTLKRIPPLYREPLILYYWEGRSVKQVAEHLGLSEDAAVQRLSRGRRYMKRHVAALVDRSLEGGKPSKAFTAAVMVAISARAARARAEGAGTAAAGTGSGEAAGGTPPGQLPAMFRPGWLSIGGLAAAGVTAILLVAVHLQAPRGGASGLAGASAIPGEIMRLPIGRGSPRSNAEAPTAKGIAKADAAGTLRLEGQVVDADLAPVAGAVVSIDAQPLRQVETGADGVFVFDELIGRIYTLEARRAGDVSGRSSIRVTSSLQPVVLRMGRGASLELSVVDAVTAAPIAGSRVELFSIGALAATAGGDGKAVLGGLAPGTYDVAASAPGYGRTWSLIEVAALPGQTEHVRVSLEPGAPVSGTVVDAAGAPVAGAKVTAVALRSSCLCLREHVAETTSGADGGWQFAALSAETYRFVAQGRDATAASSPVDHDGMTESTGVAISLEGATVLSGRVVSSRGDPAAFATVLVAPSGESTSATLDRSSETRQVFCDERGAFRITGLPRTTVAVLALGERSSSPIASIDLAGQARQTDVTLTLEREAAIQGIVVTSSGEAIPEAQVVAEPEGGWQGDERLHEPAADIADQDGRFVLPGLPAGRYIVRAARPGTHRRSLELRRGVGAEPGDRGVRLVIEEDGSIAGTMRFADGSIPDRFRVEFRVDKTGTLPTTFDSPAGGAFRLAGVPPGRHHLLISGPGLVSQHLDAVVVEPGRTAEIGVVTIGRGRTLRGRVVADGVGVAGAEVAVGPHLSSGGTRPASSLLLDAPGTQRATTASDGTFAIDGIARETVYAAAEHARLGRSAARAVPVGAESPSVELALQATGALRGRIGRSPAAAEFVISATPEDVEAGAVTIRATTDDRGEFRFDALAPGAYRIAAQRRAGEAGTCSAVATASVSIESRHTAEIELAPRPGPP